MRGSFGTYSSNGLGGSHSNGNSAALARARAITGGSRAGGLDDGEGLGGGGVQGGGDSGGSLSLISSSVLVVVLVTRGLQSTAALGLSHC